VPRRDRERVTEYIETGAGAGVRYADAGEAGLLPEGGQGAKVGWNETA